MLFAAIVEFAVGLHDALVESVNSEGGPQEFPMAVYWPFVWIVTTAPLGLPLLVPWIETVLPARLPP